MPNLLFHYGSQGALSRVLFASVALPWILLGCLIPDLPWIGFRALGILLPGVDIVTIRLYAITQASLLFTLIACGFFALLAPRARLVFVVLGVNALLHLVLDGLQEKWGAGSQFLAPLVWFDWNTGLFAIEGPVTFGVTAVGLALCVWWWVRWRGGEHGLMRGRGGERGEAKGQGRASVAAAGVHDPWRHLRSPARLAAAGTLLLAYLLGPLAFMDAAYEADTHFVRSVTASEGRPGRAVTFDRGRYVHHPDGADVIVSFTGEELRVVGARLDRSATVSARGAFVDDRTVRLEELRVHLPWFRDGASYLGLLILLAFWLRWAWASWRGWVRPRGADGGTARGGGVTAESGGGRRPSPKALDPPARRR